MLSRSYMRNTDYIREGGEISWLQVPYRVYQTKLNNLVDQRLSKIQWHCTKLINIYKLSSKQT